MSEIIKYTGDAPCITIVGEAEAKKAALLTAAAGITVIADAFTLDDAVETFTAVKSYRRALEAARVEAKAPALDIGRRIDALAKEHDADLAAAEARLSGMIAEHQRVERRKADEARREAERKEAEIRAELTAKERARVAEETKSRTGSLANDLDVIRDQAEQAIVAVRVEAKAEAIVAPKGSVKIRTTLKHEVTDIALLHAARPDLTVIEVNDAAVRAALKNPTFAKSAQEGRIPGLTVREETKAF